jgi:hypothetical protein
MQKVFAPEPKIILEARHPEMEGYIGTKILFDTTKGQVCGVLKDVEEELGKLIVEEDDKRDEICVEDIISLEILEEQNGAAGTTPLQEAPKSTEIESIAGKTAESRSKESDSSAKSKTKAETMQAMEAGHGASAQQEDLYYQMMSKAFEFFGPLEDEFAAIAARQMYKVFTSQFGTISCHVEIIVSGDDVFSRIGLVLARLLASNEMHASFLVCSRRGTRDAAYRESLLNSGGKIVARPSGMAAVYIICCNRSRLPEYPVNDMTKGIIFADVPETAPELSHRIVTGMCFGMRPSTLDSFRGTVYFVDIEYPNALYLYYGTKKPSKNKIQKLK